MSQSQRGIVKWFSRMKGYGFIEPEDGGEEIFVHYTAIEGDGYRNLYEGDRVEYTAVDFGKGPQAKEVRALGYESHSNPVPAKATPTPPSPPPPPPAPKPQASQPEPTPAPPPKKSSWLDWFKIFKK